MWPGFVETHIFPIEEDAYDHEYDEVPSDVDEEPVDKNSTPEVTITFSFLRKIIILHTDIQVCSQDNYHCHW